MHNISRQSKHNENWLVIYASYLDLWDARRYCVFKERHLTIYVNTYMKWYLSITRRFITPTWSCFLRCSRNLMHYMPRYWDKIDWYAILFYIQHLLNTRLFFLWIMTINWLMYIDLLLNTGGSESSNNYLWRCRWDEMYYS